MTSETTPYSDVPSRRQFLLATGGLTAAWRCRKRPLREKSKLVPSWRTHLKDRAI